MSKVLETSNSGAINVVVALDKKGKDTNYIVVTTKYQKNTMTGKVDWRCSNWVALPEDKIKASINKGDKWLNVGIVDGKIKGITGSLDRLTKSKIPPFIIVSQLISKTIDGAEKIVGYRVIDIKEVNTKGIKFIPIKKDQLVKFGIQCKKNSTEEAECIPVQNAKFIAPSGNRAGYYQAFTEDSFFKEYIVIDKGNKTQQMKDESKAAVAANRKDSAKQNWIDSFNKEQLKEIKLGKDKGIKYMVYANPKLSAKQMAVLRKALENKVRYVDLVAKPEISVEAMGLYVTDLKNRIDITQYLNPKFTVEQLGILSTAVDDGVDISEFNNPNISARSMEEIYTRKKIETWGSDALVTQDVWASTVASADIPNWE